MEYAIISGSDSDEVSQNVNEKLEERWQLHGELKVISGTPNTYVQAMVKYGEYEGGNDYNLWIQTSEAVDEIKYALKEIAEAIETAATALGHASASLSDRPSEPTQPQATSAKKASRKKR